MDEKYALLDKFLRNGMDISKFRFQTPEDKMQLFGMYKEYLIGLNNGERDLETLYDLDSNIVILLNGIEFCTFEITYDYETLLCHTGYDLENSDLLFILTTFFLTLKELSAMINQISNVFSSLSRDAPLPKADQKSGRYKNLPISVQKSMNKIKKLQKSILAENEKLKTVKKEE